MASRVGSNISTSMFATAIFLTPAGNSSAQMLDAMSSNETDVPLSVS